MSKFLVLCVFLLSYQNVDSARILGIFPMPSISHQQVFQPIWKELSLRGHQVTVLTPNPLKDSSLTNLTEIDVSYVYQLVMEQATFLSRVIPYKEIIEATYERSLPLFESFLQHPQIQEILKLPPGSFDVVLVESIVPVMYAFASKFNCPLVSISSFGGFSTLLSAMGTPTHPVLDKDPVFEIVDTERFYDRLAAVYAGLWFRFYYHTRAIPAHDALARIYFGNDIPYLGDIERNISLLLISTNAFISKPRPYSMTVVDIDRIHIKPKKSLPKDLQDYLDSSKQGVVYFSLGSNVKSSSIHPEKLEIIKQTLGELPFNVLWKFEDEELPGKPSNVKISKWFPQQDVLGHKNIKVFVTQGGMQSIEEAIVNRVPMVGIPFFADQKYNVRCFEQLEVAVYVDFETLSKDGLKDAIMKVVTNKRYKETVADVAEKLEDEPVSSLEKSVWWIEYVIRNKGTTHLRNVAADISWIEYLLIDVIATLTAVLFLLVYTVYKIISFIYKKIKNLIVYRGQTHVGKKNL